MNLEEYPLELKNIIKNMKSEEVMVGCSDSKVYKLFSDSNKFYLKIAKSNIGLENEYKKLYWLQGKLLVPEIIYFGKYADKDFLLTREINGKMAFEINEKEPIELIKLLVEGIKMFENIDISKCKFNNSLDIELKQVLYNIENNLIDMKKFKEHGRFDTPIQLYEYLLNNRPKEELILTHGDYCLPNIIIDKDKISGFIDIGSCGIADKYKDISTCVWSMKYNGKTDEYIELFFKQLEFEIDFNKLEYYNLLSLLY